MKRILVIGDSNTYGWLITGGDGDVTGGRLPFDKTWPGVMASHLRDAASLSACGEYEVIADGLCGRTSALEPNTGGILSGADYMAASVAEHFSVPPAGSENIVMIMLGTNDLGDPLSRRASDIASGIGSLASAALTSPNNPAVIIISPSRLTRSSFWITETSVEESAKLADELKRTAEAVGAAFLDAADFVPFAGQSDGVHLSAEDHAALGIGAANFIKENF